ncbi:MAG: M20/M25/M40 family metallo-hydrolase [Hyphomonadaceae bacterium]|nr:M20/M25/M40 family metallo-hydrolase [Hyphomonadaceae bacterium]
MRLIDRTWDEEIVPLLADYVRIPAKSPDFDPDWAAHGYIDQAVAMFVAWAKTKLAAVAGASVEIVRLDERTPLIFIDIPGEGAGTILLYGHLDKQPEMTGWSEGLGPWQPVIRDGKLYGRGCADDGYAMFGAITALLALKQEGKPHPRCAIMIEACEESGSPDLPHYVEALADRLGEVFLVVCLDSGAGDYDRLWLTTSLRGLFSGTLSVSGMANGLHSGDASGVAPSSFDGLRVLLNRVEDPQTGKVRVDDLHVPIPEARVKQAGAAAEILGAALVKRFGLHAGVRPLSDQPRELVLNRTWRPTMVTIGFAGLPDPKGAGNVLEPGVAAKLSFRLPPTLDAGSAAAAVKQVLEQDPPHGLRVKFEIGDAATGWDAPAMAPWLERSIAAASQAEFGAPPGYMGEGGSIPFMGMLGARYPKAQFVITGVLGPGSNAHGPDEFLHIPFAKKLTAAIARIISDAHAAPRDE